MHCTLSRTLGLLVGLLFVGAFVVHSLLAKYHFPSSSWTDNSPTTVVGVAPVSEGIEKLNARAQEVTVRATAHLTTDKGRYRRGENIYWRANILDTFSRAPLEKLTSQLAVYSLEIVNPKGTVIATVQDTVLNGVVAGVWTVPRELVGGDYQLRLVPPKQLLGLVGTERNITILAFRPRQMRLQLEFLRKGYGPGDEAVAVLEVAQAAGGVPVGASVVFEAVLDGHSIFSQTQQVADDGRNGVFFRLPSNITRGEGTLTATVSDGAVVESVSKTIPALVDNLKIRFYPAGGYLIAGVVNNMFVEAQTPWGEPVEVHGQLCDRHAELGSDGDEEWVEACHSTVVKTQHEGRGSVMFTPTAGATYKFKVTKPAGISRTFPLPRILPAGATLMFPGDERGEGGVFAADEPVQVVVAMTTTKRVQLSPWPAYNLRVFHRERELVSVDVASSGSLLSSTRTVTLPPLGATAVGVLRATLFDHDGMAVAERLLYRHPEHALAVSLTASPEEAVPGAAVTVTARVTDPVTHQPIKDAFVSLYVTDDATLQLIEKRKQPPRLPAMAYLEHEVCHLYDAHEYLSKSPNADFALSALLGTQGWRRFVYMNPEKAMANDTTRATRLLGLQSLEPFVMPPFEAVPEVIAFGALPRAMPMMAMAPRGGGPVDKEADGGNAPQMDLDVADESDDEEGDDAGGEVPPVADVVMADEVAPMIDRDQAKRAAGAMGFAPQRPRPVVMREYAHAVRDSSNTERHDFTETVYYAAALKTNEQGEVTAKFGVSDSITTFRVLADAAASVSVYDGKQALGALGAAEATIASRPAFYTEVKVPVYAVVGDVIRLPVSVVNNLDASTEASVTVSSNKGGLAVASPTQRIPVGGKGRARIAFDLTASAAGVYEITTQSVAGGVSDRSVRQLVVYPNGYPIKGDHGGMVSAAKEASVTLRTPETALKGSLNFTALLYPSPVASLMQALQSLLREPCGCFEQTSATSYPLVMAQQYFMTHSGVPAATIQRASTLLETSYQRLTSFEVKGGGFEWFGAAPAHEALTAYGLLQFIDMAKVREVDPALIERTRNWLTSRRRSDGSFDLNTRHLDSFGGAPAPVTNAYIVWTLTYAGVKGLQKEVDYVASLAETTSDPYLLGLVAGTLYNVGRKDEAGLIAAKIKTSMKPDGSVVDADTTITSSRGDSKTIETTAMAILVWMNDRAKYGADIHKAMTWLVSRCQDGSFGTTQGTILALKAIIAYDAATAESMKPGSVAVLVDGVALGTTTFSAGAKDAIEVLSVAAIEALSEPGKHVLTLRMTGGFEMPYSVSQRYYSPLPATAEPRDAGFDFEVKLSHTTLREGQVAQAHVALRAVPKLERPTGMVIARVGLPGGLEPRVESLQELVAAEKIAFFELAESEVRLYWRSLDVNQHIDVTFDATAGVPGDFVGPASRAYQYYGPENTLWVPGVKAMIAA